MNCKTWAEKEYDRRVAEWLASGAPKGMEPYKIKRPSRLRGKDAIARWIARRVPNYMVGWRDLETGSLITMGYGPADQLYALHWWQMLRLVSFRGMLYMGDTHFPTTQMSEGW